MYGENPYRSAMPREPMGVFRARLTLFSADRTRSQNLDLVVDTGSLWTWIPAEIAIGLGIVPTETWAFQAIDGRVFDRPIADAPVECQGRRGVRRIVFAEPGDLNVLGADTMEGLGLEVIPGTRTIRPMGAVPAYAA